MGGFIIWLSIQKKAPESRENDPESFHLSVRLHRRASMAEQPADAMRGSQNRDPFVEFTLC